MKKRAIASFIVAFILVLVLALHFSVPFILTRFAPQYVVSNVDELCQYIDSKMELGNEKITVFVDGLSDEDLISINEQRDCFYGTVVSYRMVEKYNKRFSRITFTTQPSDNYYVYSKYVKGENIDSSNEKALELYDEVKNILHETITDGMTDYEKEVALHDYLVLNCAYEEDEEHTATEDIYHSYGALVNGRAVCNGYAEAFSLLLKCSGIKVEMITGTAGEDSHAWNLVCLDDTWYQVDVTWDDPVPDEKGQVNHTYMNVTDEYMILTHSWNQNAYVNCQATVYNYYVYNERYFDDMQEWKSAVTREIFGDRPTQYAAMVKGFVDEDSEMQFILGTQYVKTVKWVVNGEGSRKEVIITLDYFDEDERP